MTDVWQGGKTYVPGAVVRPKTTPPAVVAAPTNADFEGGDTGWDKPTGWSIGAYGGYSGSWCARFTGPNATTTLLNTNEVPVSVGQRINAGCFVLQGGSSSGQGAGAVLLVWLDAGHAFIGQSSGNIIATSSGGWKRSSVSAIAPAGAAYVRLGGSGSNPTGYPVSFDAFSWDYAYKGPPSGLVYKATQADPGKSGTTEPVWPDAVGVSVTDNEVTWEGVIATQVIWEASPIMRSGATEPTWPLEAGGVVHDGNMDWIAVTSQITDANCPNSKVVAIMASKIFAADGDIVRFSATVNPLDWTSTQDAGYLPTGLQQANSNDMAVLAPYRSNLTALNASSFQNWQVDPDPSAMALLDQMDGIGSTWQHAAQPVGNDLFYLSQLGVRSVNIAAGTNNLEAGDVGMSIDPLVQDAIKWDATSLGPRSTYYPSAGQYWLAFDADTDHGGPIVYVCTMNGGKPKWSRYAFPFAVDAFAQLGNDLYIRHGDEVSIVDEEAVTDDVGGVATNFDGVVQWPWLDFGQPGVTKMMEGFDIVGSGAPSVSIGYDQRNLAAFTDPYAVSPDTMPGGIIPLPVAAPTLSVKINFAGGQAWNLQAFQLYLDDMRGGP